MSYKTHDEIMKETRRKRKPENKAVAEAKLQQDAINIAYYNALGTDDGCSLVLADLKKKFEQTSLIRSDNEGRSDVIKTAAMLGAYEVVQYIKQRVHNGGVSR